MEYYSVLKRNEIDMLQYGWTLKILFLVNESDMENKFGVIPLTQGAYNRQIHGDRK